MNYDYSNKDTRIIQQGLTAFIYKAGAPRLFARYEHCRWNTYDFHMNRRIDFPIYRVLDDGVAGMYDTYLSTGRQLVLPKFDDFTIKIENREDEAPAFRTQVATERFKWVVYLSNELVGFMKLGKGSRYYEYYDVSGRIKRMFVGSTMLEAYDILCNIYKANNPTK